jgi:hypothetical protein
MQYSPSLDFDSRIRGIKKTRSFFHSFRRENITIDQKCTTRRILQICITTERAKWIDTHSCTAHSRTEKESNESQSWFCLNTINNLSYVSIRWSPRRLQTLMQNSPSALHNDDHRSRGIDSLFVDAGLNRKATFLKLGWTKLMPNKQTN